MVSIPHQALSGSKPAFSPFQNAYLPAQPALFISHQAFPGFHHANRQLGHKKHPTE
jgi:hypothetical protein